MDTRMLIGYGVVALLATVSLTTAVLAITSEDSISETESEFLFDPLIQDVEGHDHRNGSQHNLSTPNFE